MTRALLRASIRPAAALLLQTVFLVVLWATDGYDIARNGEAWRIAATYTSVVALFVFASLAWPPRSRAATCAVFTLFVLFVAVNFARIETTGAFDYAFVHYNVRELATPLGRRIVGGRVKGVEVVLLLLVPIAFGAWAASKGSVEVALRARTRVVACIASLAVVVALPLSGVRSHESLTSFAASAVRFYAEARAAETIAAGPAYPYVHRFVPSASARELAGSDRPRPHVILLFLESWSGVYTDRARPSGGTYTPVFDARRREGLTFDYFYGNSIQSSRGRFATLCSLIPMMREKDVFALADAPLRCLPRLLADNGYRTLIASASDEPEFENSESFFRHIGFADTSWQDAAARHGGAPVWGAGLQDDAFYRSFFARLDAEVASDPSRPVFAVGINVSHHYPFSESPAHVPAPEFGSKYRKNFVGSLTASDAWLATFFEELERRPAFDDALVVLVGDHSFPADEHGVHFNGLGAREESFRTGFALRWKGHVPTRVVSDRAASQLDVAPTIADLLQMRHRSHFIGRSLVAPDDAPNPVPMVQPYDGVRLVAVRYPYKLERHEAADQEHLYDLSRDPDEEHDLIAEPALGSQLLELRTTLTRIRTNDAILGAKRVWPSGEEARRCSRAP